MSTKPPPRGQRILQGRRERAAAEGAEYVIISAKIEAELAGLDDDERQAFLAEMGLDEPASTA